MIEVEKWMSYFTDKRNSMNFLKIDYGENYPNLESKRKSMLTVLNLHKEKYGNEPIIIIRAPGRINLMGRHIDHQGGNSNLIAIDREIFLTVSRRKDPKIFSCNFQESLFPKIDIDFTDYLNYRKIKWVQLINDHELMREIRPQNGVWDNYFKASFLRLANLFENRVISGANFSVLGNIPIAAGVSSSSALTVGIFEGLVFLNNIQLSNEEKINLCSEAEWFVGTRGGSADHVAILLGRRNQIAHVKFFDLELLEWVDFHENCEVLLCNVNIIADKSSCKRDIFNERVLAYDIGFNIILQNHREHVDKLNFLRDITPENLGISTKQILQLLLEVPEYMNFDEVPEFLGEKWEDIRKKYPLINTPQKIPIRKILAYGIGECARSKSFINLLKKNDLNSIGKLMETSHDGDRVVSFDAKFKEIAFYSELTENDLNALINKNRSSSQDVKIEDISGGYGCSIPEIDFIVDITKNLDGVIGVQLSGAGLGGCAMILVDKTCTDNLMKFIQKQYQKKFKRFCSIYVVKPVNGCSIYNLNNKKFVKL